jgi:hypothetical protein
MISLLLAIALQDEAADVLRKLSDDSAEVRANAADALVERGRKGIPLVRRILEKAEGDVKAVARKCLERIDRAEVRALLEKAGHKDLDRLVPGSDDVLAKLLPDVRLHLLPTTPACED